MALLTVQDIKDYLRIEHSAEDAMLAGWRAQAIAAVEAEIGRPILMEQRTFVLDTKIADRTLFAPMYPFASDDSSGGIEAPELTDENGDVLLEDTDYRIDYRAGMIHSLSGCFAAYPYVLEVWVGLEAAVDYADRIEPALNAAILDVVADRYQRRNPAATNEDATGVSSGYSASNPGLPQRVRDLLAPWRVEPIGA